MRILKYVLHLFLGALLWHGSINHAYAIDLPLVPEDKNAAVILSYHRIGEDAYPETNIRTAQFQAHINELMQEQYHILPLLQIITAQKNDTALPPRSIAITFDGSHRSILETAIPLLQSHNIPFTIFIAPDQIDSDSNRHISWPELRKLARNNLVTIGLHPASYTRLYSEPEDEIKRQINKALARSRQELGRTPSIFAYPFGETSLDYINIIKSSGFEAAYGQYSGASAATSNMYNLPRFSMTETFGDMERFRMVVNALPIHAQDIVPTDPMLSNAMPDIGFTLAESLENQAASLSCFISDTSKPVIERLGKRRIELRLKENIMNERIRVNCTMPVPKEEKYEETRWRWLGMLLVNPHIDHAVSYSEFHSNN